MAYCNLPFTNNGFNSFLLLRVNLTTTNVLDIFSDSVEQVCFKTMRMIVATASCPNPSGETTSFAFKGLLNEDKLIKLSGKVMQHFYSIQSSFSNYCRVVRKSNRPSFPFLFPNKETTKIPIKRELESVDQLTG